MHSVYTARAAWSKGSAASGFFRINGVGRDWDHSSKKDNIDGYIATIGVLDLVVQVFRLYGNPSPPEFIHSPRLAPAVRRIWPPLGSFVWPPGPALTEAGVAALGGADPEAGHAAAD